MKLKKPKKPKVEVESNGDLVAQSDPPVEDIPSEKVDNEGIKAENITVEPESDDLMNRMNNQEMKREMKEQVKRLKR